MDGIRFSAGVSRIWRLLKLWKPADGNWMTLVLDKYLRILRAEIERCWRKSNHIVRKERKKEAEREREAANNICSKGEERGRTYNEIKFCRFAKAFGWMLLSFRLPLSFLELS